MSVNMPSVRYALLAIAAGDKAVSCINGLVMSQDYRTLHEEFQWMCLRHLSRMMSALSQSYDSSETMDPGCLRAVLVSIFLLVTSGARTGQRVTWLLHMRAFRILLNTCLICNRVQAIADNALENNIIALLHEFQTWSDITSVDHQPNTTWPTAPAGLGGPFHTYVGLIQRITDMARLQDFYRQANCAVEYDDRLRQQIEDFKRIARQRATEFTFPNDSTCRSYYCMIEAFHQAALIYLFRTCADADGTQEATTTARNHLFAALRLIPDFESIAHCLAWPLLVAGTEAHGDVEDQQFVESGFCRMIMISGTLDRLRILGLLHIIWESAKPQSIIEWIKLAQRGEYAQDPVLIQ